MSQRICIVGAEKDTRIQRNLEELGAELTSGPDADFVLTASGEDEPASVAELWQKRDEAELLLASRGARSGWLNRLYRRWLRLPYFDYTSGLRLYSASALRRAGANVDEPIEALVRLHVEGFKIKELHVPSGSRTRTSLLELWKLRRLRQSPRAADADELAFDKHLRKRQELIVSYLEVDVPLLDVGCGSARLIQSVAKGVGLDLDVRKVRYLRSRAPAVVAGSLEGLPFRDASFPQVVCSDVLGYVPRDQGPFAELRRVLRPGGTLVVGTPDHGKLLSRFLGNSANPYTEVRLRAELEENGFAIDTMKRVGRSEMVCRAIRR